MNKIIKNLDKISYALIILSLVIGGIIWLSWPSLIPVHFSLSNSPDRLGSKSEFLLTFIIPLFGLYKVKSKEYYANDTETNIKKEKAQKKGNLIQFIIAFVSCSVFYLLILLVSNNL